MGLVARVIEESGIPTMLVSTGLDLTRLVKPPRSLFVNFPMGNPFGPPGSADYQRRILTVALELTSTMNTPGDITELRDAWPADFQDKVEASLLMG
ncbi:MAG: hypothetical protein GXP35_03050 [Actinobacteria bacterium]|nr:hypothetical protein [Actinomycetota bacterium]